MTQPIVTTEGEIREKKDEKPIVGTSVPEQEELEAPIVLTDITDSLFFNVSVRVTDTDGATAAKYGPFFIAPFDCVLMRAFEAHGTAGSDAGAVTLDVEKLTDTTAKGSGVSMLESTFNLKSTANTYVEKAPTTTLANRQLLKGQRVALLTSGTLTAVNDVVVTVVLKTDLKNLTN